MNPCLVTHSLCLIHSRLPVGAGAGTLGNVTFVGILGTFLSFSGACEGNSQGLDFPGSLGTRLRVPSPPPSVFSLSSSLRGSALSKVPGEQCAARPVWGRQRQIFTQVCLWRNHPLASCVPWVKMCDSQPSTEPRPVLNLYMPCLNFHPQAMKLELVSALFQR